MPTLNYPGTPGDTLYMGSPVPPAGVEITTLRLAPERTDTSIPLTFGQPFKAGDVNPASFDLKVFSGATQLVSQADEIALHTDGSVRFAVMSALVPSIVNGVEQTLTVKTVPKAAPTVAPLTLPAEWQLNATATIYRHQLTAVRFTNRTTGGYVLGETVQLSIAGIGATETYTVTIKNSGTFGNQTGVGFDRGMNIATEFASLMASSVSYRAFQSNYERLFIRPRDPAGGAFTITVTYAGTSVISEIPYFTYGGLPQDWTVDFHSALAAKVALVNAGTATTGVRFKGPAVTEFELVASFTLAGTPHPHLEARVAVRMYAGGAHIMSDMAIEMCRTFVSSQRQMTYGLVIKNGATVKHTEPAFTHWYGGRWHKKTWYGANPEVHFKHDVPYFLDSRAVHNYDRTNVINESAIVNTFASQNNGRVNQANLGPMAYLLWRPGMGDTGGRPDIGPSPSWFAMHVLAQDKRTKQIMLAQSDAAGAWGTHFRNENTGQVVRIDTYPSISTNANYSSTPGIPTRGVNAGELDPTGMGSDLEHVADMAYIPYLVTGDYYYAEEMLFWAAHSVASRPADFRNFGEGLLYRMTLRAIAWALRNLANPARVLPETSPHKAYLNTIVNRNFNYYATTYVAGNPDVSPLGAINHGASDTAPWQMDYMASVVALSAENGQTDAQTLLLWIGRFVADRMTDPGYCIQQAAGYYWQLKTADNTAWLTTWAQMYARNEPSSVGVTCSTIPASGYPGSPDAAAAWALGATAAVYNAGLANGLTAYNNFKPVAALTAGYKDSPTWAIVPRLP
jgi:hypothetical protein